MTRMRQLIVFSVATLLASGLAVGSEIYKWTDEDGNVHYVDRPTGQPDETRLDIYSSRTDNTVVQAHYLVVTNGLVHYCCAIDRAAHSYHFLDTLPDYEAMLGA